MDDVVQFLRQRIPEKILARIPKHFSHPLMDAHKQAADEIETLRLTLNVPNSQAAREAELHKLAAFVIEKAIGDLERQFSDERKLPEDQRTIHADLILAMTVVYKHFIGR